jgi:hypothetical protein
MPNPENETLTLYIDWEQTVALQEEIQNNEDAENPPRLHRLLGLLTGNVTDLSQIAGQEAAGWLRDLARDICEPRVPSPGILEGEAPGHWQPVSNDARLTPSNYLYSPLRHLCN